LFLDVKRGRRMVLEKTRSRKIKDISGQRFGKLIALSPTKERKNYNVMWECLCDCGNTIVARQGSLKSGGKKSCGCLSKLPFGESSFNFIFDRYKRGASNRGLYFWLSKDEFRALTKQDCYYCGSPPQRVFTAKDYYGEYIYNGIDRKINAFGYDSDNCLPCCFSCNHAKGTLPFEAFMEWLNKIALHKRVV